VRELWLSSRDEKGYWLPGCRSAAGELFVRPAGFDLTSSFSSLAGFSRCSSLKVEQHPELNPNSRRQQARDWLESLQTPKHIHISHSAKKKEELRHEFSSGAGKDFGVDVDVASVVAGT